MKYETLTLGSYQTHTYIVSGEAGRCVIIDPGFEPETILDYVNHKGLTVEAILLTHGHFDHVGGVKLIAAETDCKVYVCEKELSLPPRLTGGPLYYTDLYGEGDRLSLAGLSLRVLQTPGHTPGSVCLECENVLFSGDTLFAGCCGRTDLPGGNWSEMTASLKRLETLETDYTVCPGHGEFSTLFVEKRYNPYMR